MLEGSIQPIDAARPKADSPLRPLVSFTADALRFAVRLRDADARRLICSPYSGLSKKDARALCVAAGERGTLLDAVARDRVALGADARIAALAFVKALAATSDAYRAQGISARDFVREIALAFAVAREESRVRATLADLEDVASGVDAALPAGTPWSAQVLEAALEAYGERIAPSVAPDPSPLVRRERETPSPVRRKRTHASASSLGAYAECARKWYYRYVCAAVEDKGSAASFYGTAMHWALERFHQEVTRADDAPHDELERRLDGWISTAFERYRSGFPTLVELELQRRRARRTGKRYLAWFLARFRREPFTVAGTEAAAELVLDGFEFIGYIDRLDRSDATGAVTVIDYKTGSIAESAREYLDDVAQLIDFQLPLYYWARTMQGDRVARLALVPLKDATRDVVPIELEVVPVSGPRPHWSATTATIGMDALERARTRMLELARTLNDEPIERFPVTTDPAACTFCAYRLACRERPLRAEDRFGR